MDKEHVLGEFSFSHEGEEIKGVFVGFNNPNLVGYFMDWYEEVGRESFEAAIIDL